MQKLSWIVVVGWLIGLLVPICSPASPMPQLVQVPTQEESGEDKEVTVLVDHEQLKLATITLRRGTALPTHSTPVPTTIQVLEGKGVIHVSGQPVQVTTQSIVILTAGQEHDVVPDKGSRMVLLVHYLRTAGHSAHEAAAAHEAHDH